MKDRFKFRCWNAIVNGFVPIIMNGNGDVGIDKNAFELEYGDDWDYIWEKENNTLEQCTGLKDKNGKLIYEGDILRSEEYPFKREEDGTYNYAAEVCFDKSMAGFFYWVFRTNTRVAGRSEGNTGTLDEHIWEVIGNVHENQELLKEEQ